MLTLAFFVPGPPVGKGRPRLSARGGFARAYTPAKTRQAEAEIAAAASAVMGSRPPSESPVAVGIVAIHPVPQSWTKARKQAALRGEVVPAKPDLDNMGKLVMDAMNGITYADDVQVIRLTLEKEFGAVPGVHVVLREVLP